MSDELDTVSGMDNTELWGVVSHMLAVLTIGHSGMLLVSKLIGLSEAKGPKLLAKLVECVAVFALVVTSASIVSGFLGYRGAAPPEQIPDLRSDTTTIVGALTAYFVYVGLCSAAVVLFGICYLLARRSWPSAFIGLVFGLYGALAMSTPVRHLLNAAFPSMKEDWTAHVGPALSFVSIVMVVAFRLVGPRKKRDTPALVPDEAGPVLAKSINV